MYLTLAPSRRDRRVGLFVVWFAAAVLVGLACACGALGIGPENSVPIEWVRADRQAYDLVQPELLTRLQADPAVTPDHLRQWKEFFSDWNFRITQGEELYGIQPGAPDPAPPTPPAPAPEGGS